MFLLDVSTSHGTWLQLGINTLWNRVISPKEPIKIMWCPITLGSTSKVILIDLIFVTTFVVAPNVIPSKDDLGIHTIGDITMWVSIVQYSFLVVCISWVV